MEIRNQNTARDRWYTGAKRRVVTFLPPFILIKFDGTTQLFYKLSDVPYADKIGTSSYWTESRYDPVGKTYGLRTYQNEYICRDDRGQIVTCEDVRDAIRAAQPTLNRCGLSWHYRGWHRPLVEMQLQAEERGLPIPYTGSARHRNWRGRYRSVSYMPQKRQAFKAEQDDTDEYFDYKIKGKVRVPPIDPWDGKPRAAQYDRSWKTFRSKQFKE